VSDLQRAAAAAPATVVEGAALASDPHWHGSVAAKPEMPASETAFVARYARWCRRYNSASNGIKAAAVEDEYHTELMTDTAGIQVTRWRGTISHIGAEIGDSHRASFLVTFDGVPFYQPDHGYPDGSPSPDVDDPMVPGSAIFRAAANLRDGESIVFSGVMHKFSSELWSVCNMGFGVDGYLTFLGPAG
jgi:hypothetical protein